MVGRGADSDSSKRETCLGDKKNFARKGYKKRGAPFESPDTSNNMFILWEEKEGVFVPKSRRRAPKGKKLERGTR